MLDSALTFALCDDDDAVDKEKIKNFVDNIDSDDMVAILGIFKDTLNSIVPFMHDNSLRLVICSNKYIKKVKNYGRYVNNKLDGITECTHSELKKNISIAYSVKKDNKILKFIPKELTESLTEKVNIVFIEYTDAQDKDGEGNMTQLIDMICEAADCLLGLLDKTIHNNVMSNTGNSIDENKNKQIINCLDAYKEYRYTKFRGTLVTEMAKVLLDKDDEITHTNGYYEEVRAMKINKYMVKVSNAFSNHEINDSTFNYFARAVGNIAMVGKIHLGAISKADNFERNRYMDLFVEEMETIGDIYFKVIHKMSFGNFGINEYVNKLKVSEKALYAINNKLKNIR